MRVQCKIARKDEKYLQDYCAHSVNGSKELRGGFSLNTNKETIIHLYHTNDIHSHFENWPQISRFVLGEKKRRQEAGETVLTVDIGDHGSFS